MVKYTILKNMQIYDDESESNMINYLCDIHGKCYHENNIL